MSASAPSYSMQARRVTEIQQGDWTGYWTVEMDDGYQLGAHPTEREARAVLENLKSGKWSVTAHAMDVTAKMRETAVEQGFPLFQGAAGGPRAAVELTDSLARIIFGPEADASSIVHESGHVFLHLLRRLGTEAGADGEINAAAARDWGTVRDWLGASDDAALTTAQHEQFATAFERYLAEGVAPSAELAPVFARFKSWMAQIYRSVKDIAPEIPEDVRAVFEAMSATDEQLARRRADSLGETGRDPFPATAEPPPFDPRGEAVADLAATMGLDTAPELDAHLAILEDAGRITDADRAALADAGEIVGRAEAYARAYAGAAACVGAA